MLYTTCSGISVIGLPVLILPSIEKRFSLSGKELGIITAATDVTALLCVVFISYYGDYGNKIKWVAGGAGVSGFGVLLFTLPHAIVGPYHVPDFEESETGMCLLSNKTSSSSTCDSDGSGSTWYYMMIFVIAQFILGAGICPLYSLVPSLLDENVEPKQMPMCLGLLYLCTFLGPGIGILLGGQFLSIYVDIDQPEGLNLTPKDHRWIGAWWLGYIVFGLLFLLLAIILSGYPSSLPGSKERREKHIREGNLQKKSSTKEASIKEIIPELKTLLSNLTFLFNALGVSVSFIFNGGLLPFLAKLVQLKFELDPVKNGYVLSSILTPTTVVGVLFGSFVVRQFSVKNVCKKAALFNVFLKILVIVAPFAVLIPGCTNVNMAGVSTIYSHRDRINTNTSYSNDKLISQCNFNCSCRIDKFIPVCGSDNIVYANPCYAGCSAKYKNRTFGSCSCILTGPTNADTATQGYCDRDCKNLAIFFFLLGFALFSRFASIVPTQTVVLRCVPDDKRAFATGIQYLMLKTIGLLPGPIIMGHLFDLCCRLWQDLCGKRGRCFDYNIHLLERNICIFGAVIIGVSSMLFVLSWHVYNPEETSDDKEEQNDRNDELGISNGETVM
ncbi:solute carrier organic anion transporter family member 4A1-like [Dendronephthya gigantea]|uniref:solute carrier organic anion transporter family member 4A1-like n=1 Tax=Dendronephthya gigantea TaxID=151771 RepID=UPI00106D36DA|nr:solute carrier organic anion transporter family member 4A1-like [Dendronephthya gigantea]XP_028408743.1 solute carrier organic anion transporter family member 4A1-like [Dendronephthya gigantea]